MSELERWKDAEARQRKNAKVLRHALSLVRPDARSEAEAYIRKCIESGDYDA